MYLITVAVFIGNFMVSRMDLPYVYEDLSSCQEIALLMDKRVGIADTVSSKYKMTTTCTFVNVKPAKKEEEVKSLFDDLESFFEDDNKDFFK